LGEGGEVDVADVGGRRTVADGRVGGLRRLRIAGESDEAGHHAEGGEGSAGGVGARVGAGDGAHDGRTVHTGV
jgi:hypothetical protein